MNHDIKQIQESQLASAINISIIALAQFLVFCPIAIFVYPGEFSVLSDYLSFLGCFESLSSLHAWIFNLSLIGLGSGLLWMFWTLFQVTRNDPGDLLICSVGGMFSASALVFVGLLPVNIFHDGHNFAMVSWLLFTVVTLVFWIDWQRLDRKQESTSVAKLGVIAIVAYPLAVVLTLGPAMQKVIVVSSVIWFGYFCLQLRQAHLRGDVRKWLKAGPRPKRREKRVRVHYIDPLLSADRDKFQDV